MNMISKNKKSAPTPLQTEWHHIDAKEKILGRIASQVSSLLLGKHRVDSYPHKVLPINVIITNIDSVQISGKKRSTKMYRHHTLYPGNLKQRSLAEQLKKDSRIVMRTAIEGMLPKNSLRNKRLQRVKLFRGPEHPYDAQLGEAPRADLPAGQAGARGIQKDAPRNSGVSGTPRRQDAGSPVAPPEAETMGDTPLSHSSPTSRRGILRSGVKHNQRSNR